MQTYLEPLRRSAAAMATLSFLAASPAMAGSYLFQTVTVPGVTGLDITGVNDKGEVVGTANMGQETVGFTWYNGTGVVAPGGISGFAAVNNRGTAAGFVIGTLRKSGEADPATIATYNGRTGRSATIKLRSGLPSAYAAGINDRGAVIGNACNIKLENCTGVLVQGFTLTYLDVPNSTSVHALFINKAGSVIGNYDTEAESLLTFIYSNGQYSQVQTPGSVEAFSDNGSVAGRYIDTNTVFHGYVFSNGMTKTYDYPGAVYTEIQHFGPHSSLFGLYEDNTSHYESFMYRAGEYRTFQAPGAAATFIQAVSSSGNVAGFFENSDGTAGSFLATCPADQRPCTQ